MDNVLKVPQPIVAILVYGRAPLVFFAMVFAMGIMWKSNPIFYLLGVLCLAIASSFDLVDGWFEDKFGNENIKLAYLADLLMDKVVYSILFPLLAAGAMWRLFALNPNIRTTLLSGICIPKLVLEEDANERKKDSTFRQV